MYEVITLPPSTKLFIQFCLFYSYGSNAPIYVSNDAVLIEIFIDKVSILYFNLKHI